MNNKIIRKGEEKVSARYIDDITKKRLYAESMGYCMNPKCRCKLISKQGDISEKAHIVAYSISENNSFENLVLLCPSCHTRFDKNNEFTSNEVYSWKQIRRNELHDFFEIKYSNFEDLKRRVQPLLVENKLIFDSYYEKNKNLWDKFEVNVLINNKKLVALFKSNLHLFQYNWNDHYSNLYYIQQFILHANEFENTRSDIEKNRNLFFPKEINSMFDVCSMHEAFIPSVESLEFLIKKLKEQNKFCKIDLGVENPYLLFLENNEMSQVNLNDIPRVRQLYYDYKCPNKAKVRLKSLNFALKYINSRGIDYKFIKVDNLREIIIKHKKMIFVYEYCFSYANLMEIVPEEGSVIVNLHNWNGEFCISKDALELAEYMNVKLLSMKGFYRYINDIKRKSDFSVQ